MPTPEVKLTVDQVIRYQTCQQLLDGLLTIEEAAQALSLSRRQVFRLKQRVQTLGPPGLVHGNTGRPPRHTTPADLKQHVLELATTTYAAFNFSHLADILAEEQGIVLSDETLRRWLRPLGHGRPVRRGGQHRRRRQPRAHEGELLFLDGSPHPWFGTAYPSCCLLLASDDATGKPLWGLFQPQEDRDGCFAVCYQVFTRFGLPGAFYLDRASQFHTTRHGGLHVAQSQEQADTQFERALKALGVGLIFAHSPQARGRGERLNGTFQDRLVAELGLRGLTDPGLATTFLNKSFIPRFSRRFGRTPANPHPAWRPVPQELDLHTVLCAKYPRLVANDNTVHFEGRVYQLLPPKSLSHLVHHSIEVQQWFDGTVHFHHQRFGDVPGVLIQTAKQDRTG
jgi:transposase